MKNITIFKTQLPTIDALEALLSQHPHLHHSDCTPIKIHSAGFTKKSTFVKFPNGIRIDFVYEKKKIPEKTIKRDCDAAIKEFEQNHDRRANKKETMVIKEYVKKALCLRALTEIHTFSAFYHTTTGLLIVDTANKVHASALMSCLATLNGSIKTTTLHVSSVSNGLNAAALECIEDGHLQVAGFDFGQKLNLRHIEDKSKTINFSTDYDLDQIDTLLRTGYTIKSLSLHHADLSFVLTDDFKIKSICTPKDLFDPADFPSKQEAILHEQGVMLELVSDIIAKLLQHFDTVQKLKDKRAEAA